jgi:hypothetical protein
VVADVWWDVNRGTVADLRKAADDLAESGMTGVRTVILRAASELEHLRTGANSPKPPIQQAMERVWRSKGVAQIGTFPYLLDY